MAKAESVRLEVRKTYKLYVNGEFIRSESGRADVYDPGSETSANVARASRKDLRDAVVAARAAQSSWGATTAYNRGQVLYRLTEMMDARRAQFVEQLQIGTHINEGEASRETTAAIDRALWYAGWCDKYTALVSTRNPVAGPFFNYSAPEPMGVVGVLAPDEPSLLGLVSSVIPPLVSGNSVVAVVSEKDPRTAVVFAECVATSDMPKGALNILTGHRSELAPHLARHMDVNALALHALESGFAAELQRLAAENLKRTKIYPAFEPADWYDGKTQDLSWITAFVETKTIWHPARI